LWANKKASTANLTQVGTVEAISRSPRQTAGLIACAPAHVV